MTLVDDPAAPPPADAPSADGGASGAPPAAEPSEAPADPVTPINWFELIGQVTIVLVATALALGFVTVLFESLVTPAWYHARQRHLAAEWNDPKPHPATGDAAAILQIPRLHVNLMVVQGDGVGELRGGPGHRASTPLPGSQGNAIILGNRERWGAPFGHLDQLQVGDAVVAQGRGQDQPVLFRVTAIRRTGASDPRTFARTSDHRVTLVTGRGGVLGTERLVVTAVSGSPDRSPRMPLRAPDSPSRPGLPFNGVVVVLLSTLFAAIGAVAYLSPRYGRGVVALIVTPFALASLLCLLLLVDAVLSPLR